MIERREMLKGVALLAVTEKVNDGGFAPIVSPVRAERETTILPPGAVGERNLALKCVGCGRCAAECPEKIIKLNNLGRPYLDFNVGSCLLGCIRCGRACPTGAILPLQPEMKPHVHVGLARWNAERCLRQTEKENCQACVRKCPVKAIALVSGVPVVNEALCIGCGACEHVCPARPGVAITVQGFRKQRRVTPIGEEQLLAEMQRLIDDGDTFVLARQGVILRHDHAHGIKSLLEALDTGLLYGAIAWDKVVGRAAASIYVTGGVKRVHASIASESAKALFDRMGIAFSADKLVKTILNADQSGGCPLEVAIEGVDDLTEAVKILKQKGK